MKKYKPFKSVRIVRWLNVGVISILTSQVFANKQELKQYNAAIVDNKVQFVFDLAEPLAESVPEPYAYGISPRSVIVDFDNTKYEKIRTFVTYPGRDDIDSATIIQVGDKTRLVIKLHKPLPVKHSVKDRQYILTFDLPPIPRKFIVQKPAVETQPVTNQSNSSTAPSVSPGTNTQPELAPEYPSPVTEPPQTIQPGSTDVPPLRGSVSPFQSNWVSVKTQMGLGGPKLLKGTQSFGAKKLYTGKILPFRLDVGDKAFAVQDQGNSVPVTTDNNDITILPLKAGPLMTSNPTPKLGHPLDLNPAQNTSRAAPIKSTKNNQVESIGFDNKGSSSKIMIGLKNSIGQMEMFRDGSDLIIDFASTRLPKDIQKKYDFANLGGILRSLEISETDTGFRMRVSASGTWEPSAYQLDNKLVVALSQIDAMTSSVSMGGPKKVSQVSNRDRISLNLQNIDTRSLLQIFADFSGVNIVAADSVTGNVTLRLKDVPWREALNVVLESKDLVKTERGNVIWVSPKSEVMARDQAKVAAANQMTENAPLDSYAYTLKYQRATDVQSMLTGAGGQAYISQRGSVIVDPRTNQLFITETPNRIEPIKSFLARIDVPVRQVMIEARMVEAKDDFSRNLGAKLGFADLRQARGGQSGIGLTNDVRTGLFPTINAANSSLGLAGNPGFPSAIDSNFLSLPAAALNGVNPATLAISIFSNVANRFLNLELSALEAVGDGKIISSPKVVTSNNVKALIEQGTELPYQSGTSSGATQVQFKKANLRLEVTPQITPDNNVLMDVDIANDSVGISTSNGFAIDTKHVKTQVLVENGGTVMIGGIYQQDKRNQAEKVPLLGDLPVLGNLFKTTRKTDRKVEMLIFLTPRVIDGKVVLQ